MNHSKPVEFIEGATPDLAICVAPSRCIPKEMLVPLCILISAFIGAAIAIRSISSARTTARQLATLNMIEKVESTPHYRELNKTFSKFRKSKEDGKGFDRLHNPDETDTKNRQAILDYLNHYELVSIGVENNVLEKEMYASWMKGPFIRDWNAATRFIQRERWKHNPEDGKYPFHGTKWDYRAKLFEFYQKLATDLSDEAIVLGPETSEPPMAPSGPGDEPLPDDGDRKSAKAKKR